MAEEEAGREYNTREDTAALKQRFQHLITALRDSADLPSDASANFCNEFCQILVEHGGQWKSEEDPLPLLEMYTVAILCFAEAAPNLLAECEHVSIVLEKLALSCLDFLLSLSEKVPSALWEKFMSSVQVAHDILQANGNFQLSTLMALANESGVWTNTTLCSLLSDNMTDVEKVQELLIREGPTLLDMRIKHLIKQRCVEKAAVLAKTCAEFPEFGGKKNFKQIYLVCLCEIMPQQELMQEIKDIDCKDALDMICNLESEENEKGALNLCTAFYKRQLLQGDVYCAWELTLFWSKLLIRLESAQVFLDQCRLLAQLSGSVYHVLLLIKVIQAEVQNEGLPVCIEMCIQALKMGVNDSEDCNSTICKTISCLLPLDLEVKRACQLTEFLVKPTVDSYYAVETLFNEPDQKLEEESLPIPNSLRCDLLLALKTRWPFDPEFWDWKTLKRHCLALMGDEASIVSSIDLWDETEDKEGLLDSDKDFKHLDLILSATKEPGDSEAEKKKKRQMKKLRERGFVSARFRNWQAYMQYCVLCDKEFLGHRIVKHALKHVQDGIFRCPICTKTFETRAVLEPHVALHVKQSCKERLAAMNAKKTNSASAASLLGGSKQDYIRSAVNAGPTVLPALGSSNTNSSTAGKVKSKVCSPKRGNPVRDVENTEDCSCPVTSCQKVFKYFRNLVAHVKAHKNEEEARHFLQLQSQKAICQYCRRQFVNITHLNDHMQIHCGDKPYVCIQLGCKNTFNSHAEFLMHRKVHSEFQAQCMFPNCGRVFNEAYLLYDHEAQHYITFICKSDDCGKVFYSLSQLNLHQKEHMKHELENGEGLMLHSETTVQGSMDLDLTLNQVDVPQVSSLLKANHSAQNVHGNIHDFTGEQNHTLSLVCLETHNEPPAKDPSVEHASDLSPNTDCETQSGNDPSSQLSLKPCYVKLQHIPSEYNEPLCPDDLKNADTECQSVLQDTKPLSVTSQQLETPQNTCELQNESVTNESVQPLPQMDMENEDDNLTHICPFETCTRRYSTSKSLSRHVKNVHIEAFEEWKLSRKYKRIAEIAAKKSSDHKPSNVQTPKKRIKCSTTVLPKPFAGIHVPMVSTSSTISDTTPPLSDTANTLSSHSKFPPQFEGAQSEAPIPEAMSLQSQMVQSWTSSSFDGYNSDFSLPNQYPAVVMPDGLVQPYSYPLSHTDLLSERNMDYVPSLSDDANPPSTGNPDLHASVMNEASKYVSNSLRVLHALNGDQTCEMAQMASAEQIGYMEIRQNHNTVASPDNSGVNPASTRNFSPYFSSYSSETCSSSVQSLEKTEKEFTGNHTDMFFPSNVKSETHFALPVCKEEPECFSVSNVNTTAMESEQNESLTSPEMLDITEDLSPGDKGESTKVKKIKTSKRTKWPAILKDGKVICCRCYREFSSTKSLGGHLSKRSQCKPVDEVDLTGDLPTSFLDFLNDPDISTIQTSLHANVHGQESQSFVPQHSESDALNSSSFIDISDLNYNVQNGHLPSGDASERSLIEPHDQSANSSSMPFLNMMTDDMTTRPETEMNFETGVPATLPVEDGKIMEIERALQRLGLVDGLNQDVVKAETPALQNVSSDTNANKKNNETKHKGKSSDAKNFLKPFRCPEEGCVYGAMTKEALFKHLIRAHEFNEDNINELKKKNSDKLSPYTCCVCSKNFTRTTGLKIHYKNVHHFSKEEICKLRIGRQGKKETPDFVSKYVNNCLVNSRSSTQILSTPTFKVACTYIKVEPADVATNEQCLIQEPLKTNVVSVPAGVTQGNPGLGFKSENYPRTPQDPCHNAGNSVIQCLTIDEKQALAAGLSLSPDKHCGLDQTAKSMTDKHVGERTLEQRDKSKKSKSKEKVEPHKREKVINKKLEDMINSPDAADDLIMYRPYRCIHEGCVAAFSIQQNLMLHYKAMHQSELIHDTNENSSLPIEKVDGPGQAHEFKCQVKECSKVVSKVTGLLKHYLLLHKCTLEKASALLSGVEVGKFQCDQSKCPAYFTCHLKYIDHIKNDHKTIRISPDGDFERVDLTFRCEYEGCDRVYTTKSNLLRHFMKKHQTAFETIKQKQKNGDRENGSAKTLGAKPNDGKENISSNKTKLKKKVSKKKEGKVHDHWTSFGKPTLKSKDEASAMCTGNFSIEYPCMIKGCDSVSSTERNIVKHYTTHGLTERYIMNRRSHFVFFKRNSRLRNKYANKSVATSEVIRPDPADTSEVSNFAPADTSVVRNANPEESSEVGNGDPEESSEVGNADPEDTSEIRETHSEDASEIREANPEDTSEIMQTDSAHTSDVPETDPTLASKNLNVAPANTSEIKNAVPEDNSKVTEADPAEASGITKADPPDTSGITQADPAETFGVTNPDPIDTSGVTQADPAENTTQNPVARLHSLQPENKALIKTEQLSDDATPVAAKRRRGRPRKSDQMLEVNPERKQSLRQQRGKKPHSAARQKSVKGGVAQKLFSPLGFEASVLKLFEDGPSRNTCKRKSAPSGHIRRPLKRQQKIKQNASSIYRNSVFRRFGRNKQLVRFRNPLKLESVKNVKIVMDESLSNGADILLKQLQDMRPMVILNKWLCS